MAGTMNVGAVAMVDALGWRGIWKRHDVQRLVQNVQGIEARLRLQAGKAAMGVQARMQHFAPETEMVPNVEVRFLSDTVVVAVTFDLSPSHGDSTVLAAKVSTRNAVVDLVAQLIRHAASASPPIIYRGAIVVGNAFLHQNTLLGDAIDRAAGLMDLPDGPFVWVDPADTLYDDVGSLLDYDVPLRDGRRVRANVVNPFAACDGEPAIVDVMQGFTNAMAETGGNLDVIIKRDNAGGLIKDGMAAQRERLAVAKSQAQ